MKSEVEPDPLDHPIYRTISPSLGKVQSVPQPRAPELVATPLPRLSQRAIIQSNNNNQIPVGHIQGNHLVHENRNFRSKRGWNFSISFSVLCLVNLIWAIDSSALPVILPAIAKDLDGSALQGFWAGTSPLLASTTSQLLWVEIAGVAGRKRMLSTSLSLFAIGATLAAVSSSFAVLLTARTIQGVGQGGLISLSQVMLTTLLSIDDWDRWSRFGYIPWAVGIASSPLISGILAQSSSWRWVFLVPLPLCLSALLLIPFSSHPSRGRCDETSELTDIDWLGYVMLIGSTVLVLIPLTWGGVLYNWASLMTLAPLILGITGFIYLIYTISLSKRPFIRPSYFRGVAGKAAYTIAFVQGFLFTSSIYSIPLYFEAVKGYAVAISSAALFVYTFGISSSATVVLWLTPAFGNCSQWGHIGWLISTVGTGLLVMLAPDTSVPGWLFTSTLVGVGLGIVWSAGAFVVRASSHDQDEIVVDRLYTFFRTAGQTFGVAVSGAILQNTIKIIVQENMLYAPFANQWARYTFILVSAVKDLTTPSDQEVKLLLISAIAKSLRLVWLVVAVLSAVGGLISAFYIGRKTTGRSTTRDIRSRPPTSSSSERHSIPYWI